tara:strand:+ start:303 stop:608 length:306 start_codon:yes stop_codon:yes gene_type:complete
MRANELLREQSDKLSLEELKAAIEDNEAPKVRSAGWSAQMNSFGELEQLGFMTKELKPAISSTYVATQTYTGPGPVTLVRSDGREEVINTGWKQEIEIDRS